MKTPPWLIASLALLLAAPALHAAPITVVNPSFENPVLAEGAQVEGLVPGWLDVGGPGMGAANVIEGVHVVAVPDGENVAWSETFSSFQIGQILSATLLADTLYTLQVDVAARMDESLGPTPHARISLNENLFGSPLAQIFITTLLPGIFQAFTVTFSTDASDPRVGELLEIRMRASAAPGATLPQLVFFDNVRLDATSLTSVPEPTSAALLAFGLGSIWLARRRGTTRK